MTPESHAIEAVWLQFFFNEFGRQICDINVQSTTMKTDIQDKTVSSSVLLHISVLYKSPSESLRLQYTLQAYKWHTVFSWQLHHSIPKHVLCETSFSYLSEAVTDCRLTW